MYILELTSQEKISLDITPLKTVEESCSLQRLVIWLKVEQIIQMNFTVTLL